ncbi:MAG: signal peptide peptidase SppA [Ignavibacteriae bacterium]|nr:signal peptide peptidase SppA [Ignavibacteriota bacterium]
MSKSTKWFLVIFGILALFGVGLLLLFYSAFQSVGESSREVVTIGRGDKLAVVELLGAIESSESVVRQIKKYRDDKSIKGILLRIDSPGGAVVPSQEMYEEVKKTRDGGKPVVVSMGSLAASGGYYVACGGSKLVANRGTLTGSIGVIGEFLQFHEAMSKLGIQSKTIKSGKLKDAGVPTKPMSKDAELYFQSLMDDVHRQFIRVVERERDLDHEFAVELADGRVFTGEKAVKFGLVDTLGTFEDAIEIAASLAGIEGEPSIVRERERRGWFDRMFGEVGESVKDLKQALLQKPVLSYRYAGPY